MNLQIGIVDPKIVVGEGVTVFAGLLVQDRLYEDYDVMPLELSLAEDGRITTAIGWPKLDNMARRADFPENVTAAHFNSVLTLPIWRHIRSAFPAGEMVLVRTELPGIPDDHHAYTVFGLLRGEDAALEALAGKVFETKRPLESGVTSFLGHLSDTGRPVTHTLGNSVLNLLSKPVWGFGEEKLACRSLISICEFKKFEANTRTMIETGQGDPKVMGSTSRDPDYLHFLRSMDKRGLIPAPMWETEEQQARHDKAAKQVVRERQQEQYDDSVAP